MSDTAALGSELLPPQPASAKAHNEKKLKKNFENIRRQVTIEMNSNMK
jgi:hypothetical protein